MITTIIFDLAEVYLKGFWGVEHHLEPLLGKAEEIYPKLKGEEFIALMHGEITEEEYWTKIIEKNGWEIDIKKLKEGIRDNFEEIQGVRKIIERLKESGFKLGLLSNHAKEWIDYCEKRFDYHKLFHSVLYSFEVGILKPEKKIYELILEKLDSKPDECIFIDDKSRNISAAEQIGMKTICFKSAEQLKEELNLMGFKID